MVTTRAKHWMNWGFLHTGKSFLPSRRKIKLTLVVSHHLQMQLSIIHWEFIILCKNGESIAWTQRCMVFSISMPNSRHQKIYLRPFLATAQSLLANQVNAPAKTFSYTVMNCVVAQMIVLTYVQSTMRSTLTLKKTAIKLTLLSMTLIWTYWLYGHCCFILLTLFWLLLLNHNIFIVVVYIYNIALTLFVEWKRYPKLDNNMATIMFFTQTNVS